MNIKIREAMRRAELLSMAIACLLAGAARGEAVGACRESLEGQGPNRSCERAIPKFKPVVVAPKHIEPQVIVPKVTEPKKSIVVAPPKPVLTPPKPVLTPPKLVLAPPKLVIVPITLTAKPLTLAKAPELEAGGMVGALTFVGGAILVMRGRKRRLDG
jgi:hypothetical protein